MARGPVALETDEDGRAVAVGGACRDFHTIGADLAVSLCHQQDRKIRANFVRLRFRCWTRDRRPGAARAARRAAWIPGMDCRLPRASDLGRRCRR
jgi:hypothetical protein